MHRGDETPSIPLAGSHIDRDIKTLCTRDAAECSRVPAWVNLTTHRLSASFAAVEKQTNRLSNFTKRERCFASTSCRRANSTILTGFLRWGRILSFILQANEERAEEGRRATSQRASSGRLLCSAGAFVSSTAASPPIPPHNRGQNVATAVLKWASAYRLRRQLQPNVPPPLLPPPRDRVCGRRRRQCRQLAGDY